jgi:hypothetical protein
MQRLECARKVGPVGGVESAQSDHLTIDLSSMMK